jgi:hypothetical protein
MTTDLERRIARLEASQGNADVMVESELSNEAKVLLREVLTGLYPPDLIEQIVSAKVLSPPLALSPEAKRQLADTLDALRC